MDKTILIVGTFDTKNDELRFVQSTIESQGGNTLTMDVSVLGDPIDNTDYSKHDVATQANRTIEQAIACNDENEAMQIMASGAAALATDLYANGMFDGVILLGGTMGTDLALDVCMALPIGVPKYIVSTVAFSPLIPPQRLPADVQMILWAGGLYGLNSVCKASLSQAAGAVLGAAKAAVPLVADKPLIGMTSFGSTVLKYMIALKPALEKRGFELAVFHATGMGGRAFESLASQGAFAAVMDFAPQEVGNHLMGSTISAGDDRLTNAGKNAIPQIVSIGCYDLIDFVGWQSVPDRLQGGEIHAHNRLISSVVLNGPQRRELARTFCQKLSQANGPTTLILPLQGGNEWDRPGGLLRDDEALAEFMDEMTLSCPNNVELLKLDGHINDESFTQTVLQVFDKWLSNGQIKIP